MRFIYFGSSQFSKEILKGLCLKGYEPSLVVSKPDKPRGRGLHLVATEVSSFAKNSKIPLIKPQSLKNEPIERDLKKEEANFFIVADYGEIIPAKLLKIPKVFTLCVHPSLLPLYRGATPIENALKDGCSQTGVTIFKVNEKVDAGDILLQKEIPVVYEDDFFSLRRRLVKEGVFLLIEAIKKIEADNYSLRSQDDSKATSVSKLTKSDGLISWEKSAQQIRNLIRATLGWPSAYTYYKGQMIKILAADVVIQEDKNKPGTILNVDKEGICVVTSKGILKIKKLKPEGKSEMDAWSFVCGHKLEEGESFSSSKQP